jgi:hypothetical protein
MKIWSTSGNFTPLTKKFSKTLIIGVMAIADELITMMRIPDATFRNTTKSTPPGILRDPHIPWSLTKLNPAIANKETCDPTVLRTPIVEHVELVIQSI